MVLFFWKATAVFMLLPGVIFLTTNSEFIDKFLADSKTTEEQRSAANIDKSRVDEFDITGRL